MQKKLNSALILERLAELGFTQSEISKQIEVSREAVSQWLKNETFPRPDKLLKLSQLLNFSYKEIVQQDKKFEPIISFRKVGNVKTTELHHKKAKEMGFALEKLVEFLPFETITSAPELIDPVNEYQYIQEAARAIRKSLGINKISIRADDIIKCFNTYKAILIPILIGSQHNHENALHIRLPKSGTNWVYINLDTKVFDFKFWLIHELGHILTPNIKEGEAEQFIDNFAGAFLFPEEIARNTYEELLGIESHKERITYIFDLAKRYVISPYTIYYEINKYAKSQKFNIVDLGNEFHSWNNKFINRYSLVSENLFGEREPSACEYIDAVEKEFESIFFNLVRQYLLKDLASYSFIRSILNVSVVDAKEIYECLVDGIHKNTT